jgi:DNA invertase Pin-like site-specific DNA recombinase
MAKTKPVDIYIRISVEGERTPDRIAARLAEYETDARNLAAQRDLTVGEVFSETDVSGGKGEAERRQLRAVLKRYRDGVTGGIVVPNLSRLIRDTEIGIQLLDELGPGLYAPNLADHKTAAGRFSNIVQMAADEMQRRTAGESFARSREEAIKRGIPVGSVAVGYRQKADRTIEVDQRTMPHVIRAFEMRAAGTGPTAISNYLRESKVKTSMGSVVWSRPAVYDMLKSRAYVGELRSKPYVNPTGYPVVMDPVLWHAAQGAKANSRAESQMGRSDLDKSPYMLRGLIRCAGCGHVMQGTSHSRGWKLYRCNVTHSGGHCPTPARIRLDMAHGIVAKLFQRAILPHVGGLSLESRAPESDPKASLTEKVKRAQRLLAQAETPDAQEALGDRWLTVVADRRKALEAAQGELAEVTYKQEDEPDYWTLRDEWDLPSSVEISMEIRRNRILKAVFDAIVVSREPDVWTQEDAEAYGEGALPAGTEIPSVRAFLRGTYELPRRGRVARPIAA